MFVNERAGAYDLYASVSRDSQQMPIAADDQPRATRDGAGEELVVIRGAAWMAHLNLDIGWQIADEEHVYGADLDGVNDEWRIVRYRIVQPFADSELGPHGVKQ